MTKNEYLKIKKDKKEDIIPVMYFYYKIHCSECNIRTKSQFESYYELMIKNPLFLLVYDKMVSMVFEYMDDFFEINN